MNITIILALICIADLEYAILNFKFAHRNNKERKKYLFRAIAQILTAIVVGFVAVSNVVVEKNFTALKKDDVVLISVSVVTFTLITINVVRNWHVSR